MRRFPVKETPKGDGTFRSRQGRQVREGAIKINKVDTASKAGCCGRPQQLHAHIPIGPGRRHANRQASFSPSLSPSPYHIFQKELYISLSQCFFPLVSFIDLLTSATVHPPTFSSTPQLFNFRFVTIPVHCILWTKKQLDTVNLIRLTSGKIRAFLSRDPC